MVIYILLEEERGVKRRDSSKSTSAHKNIEFELPTASILYYKLILYILTVHECHITTILIFLVRGHFAQLDASLQ